MIPIKMFIKFRKVFIQYCKLKLDYIYMYKCCSRVCGVTSSKSGKVIGSILGQNRVKAKVRTSWQRWWYQRVSCLVWLGSRAFTPAKQSDHWLFSTRHWGIILVILLLILRVFKNNSSLYIIMIKLRRQPFPKNRLLRIYYKSNDQAYNAWFTTPRDAINNEYFLLNIFQNVNVDFFF